MTEVGFTVFDATVQKTNHLLKHIEGAYGWPNERRSGTPRSGRCSRPCETG